MTTQLLIKTEVNLKKAAQKKAIEQGINLSIAINAFLEKFADGEFEFTLRQKDEPEVTIDQLFQSKKIVTEANKLAKYLNNRNL